MKENKSEVDTLMLLGAFCLLVTQLDSTSIIVKTMSAKTFDFKPVVLRHLKKSRVISQDKSRQWIGNRKEDICGINSSITTVVYFQTQVNNTQKVQEFEVHSHHSWNPLMGRRNNNENKI